MLGKARHRMARKANARQGKARQGKAMQGTYARKEKAPRQGKAKHLGKAS
jgi:hypothetical protein